MRLPECATCTKRPEVNIDCYHYCTEFLLPPLGKGPCFWHEAEKPSEATWTAETLAAELIRMAERDGCTTCQESLRNECLSGRGGSLCVLYADVLRNMQKEQRERKN